MSFSNMTAVMENEVQQPIKKAIKNTCYHCGEDCDAEELRYSDKFFCCLGCKTVFEILDENGLCDYYDLEKSPGINLKNIVSDDKYAYLDNEKISKQLSDFVDDQQQIVTLYIPSIHCSSCIWLLENFNRLKEGVKISRVQFTKKQINLHFNPKVITLRELVETLVSIGYEPQITLDSHKKEKVKKEDRSLYLKIGVSAFCFGNIMLLAFPEYFGIEGLDVSLKRFFSYISLALSIPIVFYSATDYFKSAFKGINQRHINIDVPIAIGIVTLFLRSVYEILWQTGNGYLDSLAGLLFFLLIGKWFQIKTYQGLSFERDYKSYFPIAINKIIGGSPVATSVHEIEVDDEILIKNNELIPADAVLLSDSASIDYSFVTGESLPAHKVKGDYIYAGGKQKGSGIRLSVKKSVSQSYLTQLWNNDVFQKSTENNDVFIDKISKYFTLLILLIAVGAAMTWYFIDASKVINAFTAVLIVACPCALALSTPFTMGNVLRVFGNLGLYLKNSSVIQKMSTINHIIFDKTGTITYNDDTNISFVGKELNDDLKSKISSLAFQSTHPLSSMIYKYLNHKDFKLVEGYKEITGEGIEGYVDNDLVKMGSYNFITKKGSNSNSLQSEVHVAINDEIVGHFKLKNKYREEAKEVMQALSNSYTLSVLSGDNDGEKDYLKGFFVEGTKLNFNQLPKDKLDYIAALQRENKAVLMLGDGLNDAGALKQSNMGIVLTENINNFTPASDGIMSAKIFATLPQLLRFSITAKNIIYASFVLSFLYNIVGLSFAVSGNLTPVFAAILMPLSSISVVLFTTFAVNIMAKRTFKTNI